MSINSLAPHTAKIFEEVSKLDCIKPYTLVGGTALSLQIENRQSEDLDFMSWKKSPNDQCDVEWNVIANEIEKIGVIQNVNLMGFDHVEFIVDGVKLSFYASDKSSSVTEPIDFLNNIKLADIISIGAMKMEVMLRRSAFRDYYDIYSILKSGVDINILIDKALTYSRHRLKTKNILSILTSGERFAKDARFDQLNPKYDIDSKGIETYLRSLILQ